MNKVETVFSVRNSFHTFKFNVSTHWKSGFTCDVCNFKTVHSTLPCKTIEQSIFEAYNALDKFHKQFAHDIDFVVYLSTCV